MALVKPLIIAGPTASGKSDIALRVAERDDGCVINADALQVYGCWRVLTARPGPDETARACHELYGHVSCDTRYSVGAWLRDLESVLTACRLRDQRPIVVGGTGLYLTALTEGLADIPAIPQDIHSRSGHLIQTVGIGALRDHLAEFDRKTLEMIDANNPVRVQRAWEVHVATGRGLANWHQERTAALLPRDRCECIVLNVDKPLLIKRIERRFDEMIHCGALEECQQFIDSRLDWTSPSARVLGASALMRYLQGEHDLASAIEKTITATRRYAKRQGSWYRGRMADWKWIDPQVTDPIAAISDGKVV